MCFARNHRRHRAGFGIMNGGVDGLWIMAINFLHIPAAGLKARHLISAVRQLDRPIDGDVVIVPEHDQL